MRQAWAVAKKLVLSQRDVCQESDWSRGITGCVCEIYLIVCCGLVGRYKNSGHLIILSTWFFSRKMAEIKAPDPQ